jgi:hypothetical protein
LALQNVQCTAKSDIVSHFHEFSRVFPSFPRDVPTIPHPFSMVFPWFSHLFRHQQRAPPWTRQVQRLADELQKYDTDFETPKIWVGKQVRMAIFCGQWMGDTLPYL